MRENAHALGSAELLQAALIGYEASWDRIQERISELRNQLKASLPRPSSA
jgi:hypothetical protein